MLRWFEYFNSVTPADVLRESDVLEFERRIAADRVACPFLINNECSIYPVRPLVCRTHAVNDTAELCKDDPHRNGDSKGVMIQATRLQEITRVSDMAGVRLLTYATAETLGITLSLKPMEQIVTPTLRQVLA